MAEESLEMTKGEGEVILNAIACHSPPSTLKLTAIIKGEEIQVLIDSRSTNSFIYPKVLQKIHVTATRTYPLIVTVSNGNKTVSRDEVSQLEWEMQKFIFKADLRVLRLAGCQMVLGVDWLRTLIPVTFDFKKLTLQFLYKGKSISL